MYPGESQTLYTFNVEDSEEDGAKMYDLSYSTHAHIDTCPYRDRDMGMTCCWCCRVLAKFAAYDWDQIRALHEEVHTHNTSTHPSSTSPLLTLAYVLWFCAYVSCTAVWPT